MQHTHCGRAHTQRREGRQSICYRRVNRVWRTAKALRPAAHARGVRCLTFKSRTRPSASSVDRLCAFDVHTRHVYVLRFESAPRASAATASCAQARPRYIM